MYNINRKFMVYYYFFLYNYFFGSYNGIKLFIWCVYFFILILIELFVFFLFLFELMFFVYFVFNLGLVLDEVFLKVVWYKW